jgi:cholest-4-en-3-one 26-monooxygenase
MGEAMDHKEIDDSLTNPKFFATGNVHALFKQLRDEDPVHWTKGRLKHGFWSVTKYKDMQAVYLDPVTFSSQRGGSILPTSAETETVAEVEDSRYGAEVVNSDPPQHTRLRRLMDPAFRKSVLRKLEPTARAIVDELLAGIVAKKSCDFVEDFAMRLPTELICKIMGVPREDWSKVVGWTGMAIGQEDSAFQLKGGAFETKTHGYQQLFKYCHDLAMRRRSEPLDDLTSIIATSETADGSKLNETELTWSTLILVVAGLETVRNAMSGGILAFAENPEQMDALAADALLIPSAIEEILRWTSPGTHSRRTATKDFKLHGRQIREGDWVALWFPSANRDEEIFSEPFRFDIQRRPNRHITFGYGTHLCIGRELARLEIELMLEGVLRHNLRFDVIGPVERLASNLVAGIKSLPVNVRHPLERRAP